MSGLQCSPRMMRRMRPIGHQRTVFCNLSECDRKLRARAADLGIGINGGHFFKTRPDRETRRNGRVARRWA